MTYSSLQTDVATFVDREDLNALMPTFIRRAESFLFRELNVKDLATSVAGTTTGEYAALPSDFASVRKITVVYGSTEYALDYKSEAVVATTSVPTSYSLESNQIRIFGAGTGQAYTLYYIPKITALSDTETTNWLLDSAEDLYLYATARECARHTKNAELIALLDGLITPLLDSVRRLSERKGQPANGSLQIKART